MQKQLFLLFSLHIITVFGLGAILLDAQVKKGRNDIVKNSLTTEGILQDRPLNTFHVIVKRSTKTIQRPKRKIRRRRKRKKNISENSQKQQPISKYPDDGVLEADSISANGIQAKSMTADKIVADIIHAKTIYGRNIVVVSKRKRRPRMSEYMSNKEVLSKRNIMPSSNRYHYRPYNKRKADNAEVVQPNTKSYRSSKYANRRSDGYKYHNIGEQRKYYDGKTQNADRLRRRRRVRKRISPFSYVPYESVDTWRHPFIAFQNGFVKRKRIRKPKQMMRSKEYGYGGMKRENRRSRIGSRF